MKNLKENIHKNNMKKLMLSVVLGMFCYCTNNAMKKPIDINKVLTIMLSVQSYILNSKANIENVERKIYFKIKEQDGTVKKGRVLEFIKNQFTKGEQKQECFNDNIKKIEQYFHLEGKNDDYKCTKDNLTEIFWGEVEEKNNISETEKINIGTYFSQIMYGEIRISKAFKDYYDAKKEKNKEAQDEEILKEIMKDCCGNETEGDLQTNFLAKLGNLYEKLGNLYELKVNKEAILTTIKKRITLAGDIKEEDFIYFLKQKIEEEKKEEEKNQGGCCTCCDCWEKKKNPEVSPQESLKD